MFETKRRGGRWGGIGISNENKAGDFASWESGTSVKLPALIP